MAEIHSLILKSDSTQIKKSASDLDTLSKSASKAEDSNNKLSKSTTTATESFLNMKTAVASVIGAMGVSKIVGYADSWSLVNSRLKLATDSTEEYLTAQRELFNIAQDTRQEFGVTADLYSRLSRSTKDLRTTQEQLLTVTESVNKALIVSGASATEAESTITQLGQGLASGVLRGEEFNSIMENGSRIAQAMAQSLGVTIGELRQMAQDGKLTSEVVIKSLLDQSSVINNEFSQMPKTVSQSLTQVENSFMRLVGEVDRSTNASGGLSDLLSGISKSMDDMAYETSFAMATISNEIKFRTKFIGSAIGLISATVITGVTSMIEMDVNGWYSMFNWVIKSSETDNKKIE